MGKYSYIEFFKKKLTGDIHNKTEYVFLARAICKVKNLHGREFWEALTTNNQDTLKFYDIRYNKVIFDADVVKFNNKYYSIIFKDNIGYENRVIEIKAKEILCFEE